MAKKIVKDKAIEETLWQLLGKDKRTISEHIRNILIEGELDEKVVVRNFRTTT